MNLAVKPKRVEETHESRISQQVRLWFDRLTMNGKATHMKTRCAQIYIFPLKGLQNKGNFQPWAAPQGPGLEVLPLLSYYSAQGGYGTAH